MKKRNNDELRTALLFFSGSLGVVLVFSGLLMAALDAFAVAAW